MQKHSTFKLFASRLNPSLTMLILGFSLCLTAEAQAADFRSIIPTKAVAYDAPSATAEKRYLLSQGYPVEVIVNLGDWIKVRDQLGGLSWVQGKDLNEKRTVVVLQDADIKVSENVSAAQVATVQKDVVLELVSLNVINGWVKVKHRDGVSGYIQSRLVWGVH